MPLSQPRFTVYLNDPQTGGEPYTEHDVVITHGDQLRAELEGPKNKLPAMEKAPMHTTTLWAWCSLVRTGRYEGTFPRFMHQDMAGFDVVEDDPQTVDPTQPGADTDSLSD